MVLDTSIPTVGSLAPDFTADSTSGSAVTLSSLRERQAVLLAFFPLAFTRVCTAELCSLSEDYDAFAKRGVAVLPISVDAVPSLQAFKQAQGLHTDLLSDFKRVISRAYGVLLPEQYFSARAYFLIDKHGLVQWVHVEEHTSLKRDNAEIFAAIDTLQP